MMVMIADSLSSKFGSNKNESPKRSITNEEREILRLVAAEIYGDYACQLVFYNKMVGDPNLPALIARYKELHQGK